MDDIKPTVQSNLLLEELFLSHHVINEHDCSLSVHHFKHCLLSVSTLWHQYPQEKLQYWYNWCEYTLMITGSFKFECSKVHSVLWKWLNNHNNVFCSAQVPCQVDKPYSASHTPNETWISVLVCYVSLISFWEYLCNSHTWHSRGAALPLTIIVMVLVGDLNKCVMMQQLGQNKWVDTKHNI